MLMIISLISMISPGSVPTEKEFMRLINKMFVQRNEDIEKFKNRKIHLREKKFNEDLKNWAKQK